MSPGSTDAARRQGFHEEYRQVRESALQGLEDGEPGAALSVFIRWYRYPVGLADTDLFVDASRVFAQLAAASGNRRVADALTLAADSPTNGEFLFRLGAELFEVEGYAQAAAVLQRGLALNPGDLRIASELVLSLEAMGLNGDAVGVCESLEADLPPLLSALYLFNLTLSGRWDRGRQLLDDLEKLASAGNSSAVSVDEDADKEIATIQHIIGR